MQAIVFKDTGIAELALQNLSGRRLGKAAICPRDWIADSQRLADAAGSGEDAGVGNQPLPEGAIAWAAGCTLADGEAGALASRLLKGVVIAENLEAAFRLKSANPELAVATLAGEFISSEGIVRGGQTGESGHQSTLARRAQIAQLDRELRGVIRKLESLGEARTQAIEVLETSQDLLLAARERFQRTQVDNASIRNEQKLAERQLTDLENRRALYIQETVQIGESLRISLTHLEKLESSIAETARALEGSRLQRTQAELAAQVARERENAAVETFNEIRIRVATERQQQEDLNRQRGPMAARLAELAETLEARRADIAGYEARIETLDSECGSLRESIAAWEEQSASLEAKIAKLLAERSEVHESAGALEVVLRSARQQLIQLQEHKGRLEVRVTQLDMRLENLRNHVSQRYQIDLEAFEPDSYTLVTSLRERNKKKAHDAQAADSGDHTCPESPPEPSSAEAAEPGNDASELLRWQHVEEIVADLTERLEAMGPVNLDAIQEYDELEQRQIFLEKQNADLVNSKAELHAVILKINRTTKELFADTFDKIRENFQVMFSELFGGGRANLVLIDENDPLESGIEIIAKPPGKQLQSVSLLSGGERTMTAVALLFAIYMVKPSPFCVLDEMDAPLDESNINRFIQDPRPLRGSKSIRGHYPQQAHDRARGLLYGVTMEEHGVSKIVSVKFTTREESEVTSRSTMHEFGTSTDVDRDEDLRPLDPSRCASGSNNGFFL